MLEWDFNFAIIHSFLSMTFFSNLYPLSRKVIHTSQDHHDKIIHDSLKVFVNPFTFEYFFIKSIYLLINTTFESLFAPLLPQNGLETLQLERNFFRAF